MERLSRNAAFLLTLRDSGVRFVAADMPEANDTVVGIMAAIAQDERRRISERTKAASAEAKRRGTPLGNPKGAAHLAGLGNDAAVAAFKAKADGRAQDLRPVLEHIAEAGITSNRGVAAELNRRGILLARGECPVAEGPGQGPRWTDAAVARLRRRLGAVHA